MSLRHSVMLSFAIIGFGCNDDETHAHGTVDVTQQMGNSSVPPVAAYPQDGGPGPLPGNSISQPAPSKDAGLGGIDAGTGPTLGADAGAFACLQNSDCVVKDLGSCCGYNPGCANVGATFAAPICTNGQVGQCSLQNIDHCECQQNSCVSVPSAVQGAMF